MSAKNTLSILKNETSEEYEYDREQALRIWNALHPLIPEGDSRGYGDHGWLSTDDRIIALFELLHGSQFGDMVFGSLANFDQGSTLSERDLTA